MCIVMGRLAEMMLQGAAGAAAAVDHHISSSRALVHAVGALLCVCHRLLCVPGFKLPCALCACAAADRGSITIGDKTNVQVRRHLRLVLTQGQVAASQLVRCCACASAMPTCRAQRPSAMLLPHPPLGCRTAA